MMDVIQGLAGGKNAGAGSFHWSTESNMKNTVLFASLGRTDLQVLEQKEGKKVRISLGHNLRHFHERLLRGQDGLPWEIGPGAVAFPEGGQNHKLDWELDREDYRLPEGYAEHLSEDGNLVLVPAKLAPAVQEIEQHQDIRVTSVVLFTTNRNDSTPPGVFHNEPIAVGPIIGGWLSGQFGLDCSETAGDIGSGRVGWIDILDDGMLSPAPGRDSPVNREAMRRVEDAMRRALEWSDAEPWACLSLGGGMPEFREPVKACAEFFFNGRTFNWQAPQFNSPDFRWMGPGDEPPTTTDSYRVRRHVEALVRKGAFVEAYGAASELENDGEERAWVAQVRQVAGYVTGALSQEAARAAGVPKYLERLVWPFGRGTGGPRCLLVGLRVEAALWADRIPEAVAGTATFLDAAALDALAESLPAGCYLEDTSQLLRGSNQALNQLAHEVNEGTSSARRPPLKASGRAWRYAMGPSNLNQWVRVFSPDSRQALMNYLSGLNKSHGTIRLIDLRNLAVHSLLPPDMLEGIHGAFQRAGLWAENPTRIGDAFLGRPLARGVLRSLGINDAPDRYRALIGGLISALRQYEIR